MSSPLAVESRSLRGPLESSEVPTEPEGRTATSWTQTEQEADETKEPLVREASQRERQLRHRHRGRRRRPMRPRRLLSKKPKLWRASQRERRLRHGHRRRRRKLRSRSLVSVRNSKKLRHFSTDPPAASVAVASRPRCFASLGEIVMGTSEAGHDDEDAESVVAEEVDDPDPGALLEAVERQDQATALRLLRRPLLPGTQQLGRDGRDRAPSSHRPRACRGGLCHRGSRGLLGHRRQRQLANLHGDRAIAELLLTAEAQLLKTAR